MSKSTILVTGCCGFIGSAFLRRMVAQYPQSQFINIDKLTYAGNLNNLKSIEAKKNYHFIHGDILDRDKVESIFQEYKPNIIVNFAAESHVDRSILDPTSFLETNVLGTLMLLENAKKIWQSFDDKRFIQISTDEVYGSLSETDPPFNERNNLQPNSPYSASKASADLLIRAYYETYGFPALISRCSNNYGPYQHPEKLISLAIVSLFLKKPIPVYGDGRQIRDWIYVDDHADAIECLIQNGEIGEVYNFGGESEKRNIDVIQSICDIFDRIRAQKEGESRKLIIFVKDRPGHDKRYAMDISYVKEELNWNPSTSFEVGLNKTIDWYQKNEMWWVPLLQGELKDYYKKQYHL
ncbi:MAG: dTDP-glucose 4,6-dehydratase [Deltaproteobacteria bacterium RIFCSPLOWO2_12_FULL_40_28]|nr:MAG: dTDP-glucose 4,6-dehydratase [Deltaproteobacteria bacterium RIFCSPHIGHO2_02_FULL_40_28]OGQ19793.1 MAG: dTDP-glucose 4,6-dehydratase [Deltaproteobacteria bacterium RIFCSPHIGHO2_12_FULL_40_32]OGQ41076.1 MAG: dTDP-glucose 4,6-dehydratase [Deltaproteobacteria bacterium RIFCSPLOWO2_02_FULL_40_36]OGQ54193.1 MAG: dTDP-glucose 4,6-dehydratase [Deltaproteobacteria bacterium RIFCSPLOWO2_12_FULL_40_28]